MQLPGRSKPLVDVLVCPLLKELPPLPNVLRSVTAEAPLVEREVAVRFSLLRGFVSESTWSAAVRNPQSSCVAWTGQRRSIRAFGWKTDADSISGEKEAQTLLARSGRHGWFARADTMPFQPSGIQWIKRLPDESSSATCNVAAPSQTA